MPISTEDCVKGFLNSGLSIPCLRARDASTATRHSKVSRLAKVENQVANAENERLSRMRDRSRDEENASGLFIERAAIALSDLSAVLANFWGGHFPRSSES